jgi:hypothetical protein
MVIIASKKAETRFHMVQYSVALDEQHVKGGCKPARGKGGFAIE